MKNNIGILQLIDSLNIGGAEVLAVNIHNLLLKNDNVESFLCATRQEGGLKNKISKNYLFLRKKSIIDIAAILKLKKFVKSNHINIIHAHSSSFFLAFIIKIFLPKIKIVWHDHYGFSDYLQKRKKEPLRFISKYFSYSIFVNNNLFEWAKKELYLTRGKLLYNFPYFDNFDENTVLKGNDGYRIVKVAGLRKQKDHLNLLKSFLIISKNHPSWTLHFVGKSYEDKISKNIFKFILDNSLENKVFCYDACLDIQNILCQATIGVLSSTSEGLPISLLEYGLSKLPVVVTNVGECKKVIENNVSGILVESNNSIEFADALENLIASKEKRTNFGVNIYKEVQEKFSKEIFLKDLLNIYKNVV